MLNRRSFLKSALALGAAPCVCGAAGVAGRPTLALIGAGVRGRALLHEFLGQGVVVTVVCDCDRVRRAHRARVVNDYYASRPELGIPSGVCREAADFRDVLSDPSVDMVCIATPDHWHAYMAVEAMKRGKDVYCEPPVAYTVEEAKAVMAVAAKCGRVFQTGAGLRSAAEFRTACEIVRNGGIGAVRFVDANFGGPSRPHRDYEDSANAAREGSANPDVDFDMWCGGAPLVPYSDRLAPRGVHEAAPLFWRNDDFFGLGMCGSEGAHCLDIVQWGLGMDAAGPVRAVCSSMPRSDDPLHGGRRQRGMSFAFADGVVVRHDPHGVRSWDAIFYGTGGIVAVGRGRLAVWRGSGVEPSAALQGALEDGTFDGMKRVAFWNASAGAAAPFPGSDKSALSAVGKAIKAFGLRRAKVRLYRSSGHPADFVKCVASRSRPCSDAEVGARAAILCALCNLSYVHDAGFEWESSSNAFANGTGDASWLSRNAYRNGWDVRPGA